MIKFQFSYCPVIWIFRSRKSNNLVIEVQERALWLTYKDNENNFQLLRNENHETSVHQRDLQFLLIEIYKIGKKTALHPLCIIYSTFVKTLSV